MKIKYDIHDTGEFEVIEFYRFPIRFAIAKDSLGIQICSNGNFFCGKRGKGFSYENMYDPLLDVLEDINKVYWYFLIRNIKYFLSWRHIKFEIKGLYHLWVGKYVYTFYGYSDEFTDKLEGKLAIPLEDKVIRLYRFLFKKNFSYHVIYKNCYFKW